MDEKEYIERNAVIEEIESLSVTVTGLRAGNNLLGRYAKHYKESVVRLLTYARAADVVEVVRCKNCKHGQRGRYGYMCEYDRDKKYMNREHYCSFGEKIVE